MFVHNIWTNVNLYLKTYIWNMYTFKTIEVVNKALISVLEENYISVFLL